MIVSVAILTALAADLAYETRVSLEIAAGARDELRATYLAKSGVALSRMVLGFQQQIDDAASAACGLASGTARAPQVSGDAAAPRAAARPALPPAADLERRAGGLGARAVALRRRRAGRGAPGEAARAAFGDFEGTFEAKIEDEGRKVNAQLDAREISGPARMQVQGLYQLVCDPRWDPLFEREDANGTRTSRQDLIVHLRDWIDDDKVSSSLVASFPGTACLMEPADRPFEPGSGTRTSPTTRAMTAIARRTRGSTPSRSCSSSRASPTRSSRRSAIA